MALPITTVFADIPDPRRDTKNKRHLLTDILTLATCAIIGGAESWEAIAAYGQTKIDFFRRFLQLPAGIPSPDTFERVFAKLKPKPFSEAFGRWMASACESTGLVPIAIDGKSVRRAKKNTATGCLHVVSAWATQNRLTLGQVAVAEGSNEVAAIPELLIVIVWATILWCVVAVWPHYRWVAVAQVPYSVWVSLATTLQLSITGMNWGRV